MARFHPDVSTHPAKDTCRATRGINRAHALRYTRVCLREFEHENQPQQQTYAISGIRHRTIEFSRSPEANLRGFR